MIYPIFNCMGVGLRPINQRLHTLPVRWILNGDASPVLGKIYTWFDNELWTDANKWKD